MFRVFTFLVLNVNFEKRAIRDRTVNFQEDIMSFLEE
jgi:hypothetical protein